MNDTRLVLNHEQALTYGENGFAALGPILSAEATDELRAIFDRMFSPPTDGGKALYYDLAGSDPDAKMGASAIPQILHPSHHVPELKQSAAWAAALDIAMQLLDVGSHTRDDLIVRDHAIVKPPGNTGTTPWHQDEAYWEEDLHYNELSVWIALQDTSKEMGCMQFIPKSHKGPVVPHHSWKNNPKIIALEVDDGFVIESQAVACPLDAGGATLHHSRTLHYTSGNMSAEPRRAFILTVGTPPTKLDEPRHFPWNHKERSFQQHIAPPATGT
jgi:ectoine hydroxylase-related dioxygenase (phytanoyl-CoA dioxygenase family)